MLCKKNRVLGLVLGAALTACGGGDDHGHQRSGATCPTPSSLTYDNFGRSFVASYCTRCHSTSKQGSARSGAPSDHNFDTVEDIRPMAEHIDQRAGAGPDATNTAMPPSDPRPTADERRKLGEWLACGAP